jgi:hypothetical protein
MYSKLIILLIKILLIYSCYQYTRSSSSMQNKKITKLGAIVVIGLSKTNKVV